MTINIDAHQSICNCRYINEHSLLFVLQPVRNVYSICVCVSNKISCISPFQ